MLISVIFAAQSLKASDADRVIAEMLYEIRCSNAIFHSKMVAAYGELDCEYSKLKSARNADAKIECLVAIDSLRRMMREIEINEKNEVNKIKYLKGLQIIRILYEKVLSLDHHFASVKTINEINKMSNPNQYPEFAKLKEFLSSRKSDGNVALSGILASNSIVAILQTFSSLIGTSISKGQKESEIAKVECIIDFTLRMQSDLNTIFFETGFLQKSNERIKLDIEILFRDYTKPIGYVASLENCRTGDDWETVRQKTDEYLSAVANADPAKKMRMQVNIEFPVDRLLLFITQYNTFIDQGGKFYEKFKIILNSYEHEKQCESKLPSEYKKLKADIDLAIEKFNLSYKPVEINGSKMKEILYGINEFD